MLHALAARTGLQAANLPWKLVICEEATLERQFAQSRKTFPETIIVPIMRSPLRIVTISPVTVMSDTLRYQSELQIADLTQKESE